MNRRSERTRIFLRELGAQLSLGSAVALLGGGAAGLGVAAWVLRREHAHLLFTGSGSAQRAGLFLVTLGALGATLALLPLELLVALLRSFWSEGRRLRPRIVYSAALVLALAFVHGSLYLGFVVVRDPMAKPGLLGIASMASVALLLLLVAARLGASLGPVATARDRAPWLVAAAAVVVALLCLFAYRGLRPVTAEAGAVRTGSAPVAAFWEAAGTPRQSRKNVVLVSIDTLRADHLSCYGYERPTTPHLDELASAGALFLEARSQAPWTLPSHASMFTSRYPTGHGARFYSRLRSLRPGAASVRLAETHVTLAEMLALAGYRTGAFTTVSWLGPDFGLMQGFQNLDMEIGKPAGIVVDDALAWLDQEDERPFLLFLHFFDVHNYDSPAEFDRHFRDDSYEGPLLGGALRSVGANLREELAPSDLRYAIARYDGALLYVDREIGRLVAGLREAGTWDDTLVVVTSDHGEEFWEHGGTGHGFTLYDEQLRVPLLLKPPTGSPVARGRVDGLAAVIDVVPTVVAYLGLTALPSFDGISLRTAIEKGERVERRRLFAEDTHFLNSYAVVEDGYKYLGHRFPPADPWNPLLLLANVRTFYNFRPGELYDLATDPGERNNRLDREPRRAAILENSVVEHAAQATIGPRIVLDEETVEELRSLGYIH